jgi:hypothetical protein
LGAAFFSHVRDSGERRKIFARNPFDRQTTASGFAA